MDYHMRFGSLDVGILFASYQATFLIAAPLIGKYLHKFGRRRALLASVMIISAATTVFAIAGLIEDDYGWYIVSIVARGFQGVGEAILIITIPSIIAMEYPDKKS